MALIEDMTTLVSATDAEITARTAEDDIQLKAVAYLINSAANTGETRAIFQEKMRPNTLEKLQAKGYTVEFVGLADKSNQALIKWSSI